MSFLLRRPSRPLGALFTSLALLGAAAALPASATAADTKYALTDVYAGPVAGTTEVKVGQDFPGGRCARRPDSTGLFDSVIPLAAAAGTSTDQCIAFFFPEPDVGSGLLAASPDLSVTSGDDAKDVILDLPRGFQASPGAIPTCSAEQFHINADGSVPTPPAAIASVDIPSTCPSGSVVGRGRVKAFVSAATPIDSLGIDDDAVNGNVYNLEPGPGEIARLGVEIVIGSLAFPTRVVVKFQITGGAEPKLRAVVKDLPRVVHLIRPGATEDDKTTVTRPLLIAGVGILAWGKSSDHPELAAPAFAQHGTECGVDLSATATVTSYNGTVSTKTSAPYQLTGCGSLPFAPTVALSDVARAPAVPTPVTVNVAVPQAPAEPLTSLVKDVAVTLPAGLEVGAQVASGTSGLPLCTAAAFGADASTAATCPAGSKVGDARIDSPLVARPFTGSVFLGPQPAVGELPKLYVEASLDGAAGPDAARVKLVGSATVDATGRVTATFNGNPQLRFNAIQLKFRGGPNALFITPRTCGTTTGSSTITPSNGAAPVTAPLPLTIDQDCAISAFAPTVAVAPSNPQAGATSPTTITIDRRDRTAWLTGVKVSLPPGLLAFLKNATECPAGDATTGACPASSKIGTVRVSAGAGASPLSITGALYLVQPPAGAVAGAVIVVRAKIGDLDLGDVVVPGRIELRPTDAGLDFITTAPTRVHNLALNMRTIEVGLDRESFATNPSSCGPLGFGSSITGDGGETATPGGTVSYTGCEKLPFQPSLRATLTGDVKPLGFPGMYVEVKTRPGDTNLRATTVVLPEGVSAALPNLRNRCALADLNAGACAPETKVGSARANVSITDDIITGDVFLLSVPGEQLPGLGLSFGGRYTQRVTSAVRINKGDGRLTVVFSSIPDLPLSQLIVDVGGGPKGPLQLSRGDCPNGTRWDAAFTGQGGQTATAQTGLRCAAKSTMRISAKSGFSLRNFDFGGRFLKSAAVTVPTGYKLVPSAAKPKGRAWARTEGGTPKLAITSKALTVTTTSTKTTSLRIKVSPKAVRRTSKKKLKKGATVNVLVRFVFTDGAVQTQTVKAAAS